MVAFVPLLPQMVAEPRETCQSFGVDQNARLICHPTDGIQSRGCNSRSVMKSAACRLETSWPHNR